AHRGRARHLAARKASRQHRADPDRLGRGLQTCRGRAGRSGARPPPPRMRLPFSSLRTNLIAAFVAVIAVSLLLASGAFAYLLREYQVQRETDRLQNVAAIYMSQVVRMSRGGATLPAIAAPLDQSADDAGVRV